MELTATYPDFKTVSVSVDPWVVTPAIEAFLECGAIFVTTKED